MRYSIFPLFFLCIAFIPSPCGSCAAWFQSLKDASQIAWQLINTFDWNNSLSWWCSSFYITFFSMFSTVISFSSTIYTWAKGFNHLIKKLIRIKLFYKNLILYYISCWFELTSLNILKVSLIISSPTWCTWCHALT